ncbi:hypothetical protein BWQ96_07286 [Gracilariopsis chorda]|uniref:Uncharacterized protein n=1 Tax=Gracilariopsis chorda TaxID=448386 RepID=A0A2V3ILL9_9FLOR|nr:hypothetical protein BWQ96_07286 [Gracilariopsis chorda]|eukprot:PXF42982.1 hypothetical protein BWQ96_07286 [Gracilariopsis chorda]
MPGKDFHELLRALRDALQRNYIRNDIRLTWIAPSSLYKLSSYKSYVTSEIFADCCNESGVLLSYRSKDVRELEYSSLGSWEGQERCIEGGAGNPPFDVEFISYLMRRLEKQVHGEEPYCRLLVMPMGERYNLRAHLEALILEGELLVTIPSSSFPFTHEQVLLSPDHVSAKRSLYQSIAIVVCCNR